MKSHLQEYKDLRERPYFYFHKKYFDFISQDKFLFGAHVHVIEHALLYENRAVQKALISCATDVVRRIYLKPSSLKQYFDTNKKDRVIIRDLERLCLLIKRHGGFFSEKIPALGILFCISILKKVTPSFFKADKNAKKAQNLIYVSTLQKSMFSTVVREVNEQRHRVFRRSALQPLTPSSQGASVHLRRKFRNTKKEHAFVSIDGEYAQWHSRADWFPITKKFVSSVMKDLFPGARLAGCQVSFLPKYTFIGQHYDGGDRAKGFERYHIVIQSPKGSRMVSGCEECVFGEGDVFFLEEKKLHGAYNDFNQDRIHIIFDIVPQKGEHKGIPFNTYQDWNMWQAEREKIS